MDTIITINTNEQIKKSFEQACTHVGMTLSAGLNILMRLAIKEQNMLLGDTPNRARQQMEAFNKFIDAINTIEDEPITDDDITILANNRVHFRRDLSL